MPSKQPEEHYVEIWKDGADEPYRRMGPYSARKAKKVCNGAGINLNWDSWHIRVVPPLLMSNEDNDE